MTDWAVLRKQAVEAFGELPGYQLERDIIGLAEQLDAGIVGRTIDQLGEARDRGKVRSCWPLLKHRLADAVAPGANAAIRDADAQRSTGIDAAERWIANAGLHFDRETEVLEAIFGLGGPLRQFADDAKLQERMADLWRRARPRAARLEAENEKIRQGTLARAREAEKLRAEQRDAARAAFEQQVVEGAGLA